ncbi:MAG: ATP-dependent sacrificial sulfur transferase LarE [Desulfobacula sp.]|nr:ATP-dependent sacrificial sulfur transferase LarE [Desulfobacula sp.]
MKHKLELLNNRLGKLGRFAIAFSGGVDSTFLLAVAKNINPKKLLAVTAASQFVPEREVTFAKMLAGEFGVEHIVIDVDILSNADVVANTKKRCYYCKHAMFSRIFEVIKEQGIDLLLHAVNLDDLGDYRPGLKAAKELCVLSPLVDTGFSKNDIRMVSRKMGLETWDKPSQSCLATRIPYNKPITDEALQRIDQAEAFLQKLGFAQVRVRCHGKLARIEVVSDQMDALLKKEIRDKVSEHLIRFGFGFVSIDIDGYKTGKMNHEILPGQSR